MVGDTRVALLTSLSLLVSACFSGIIFGWPAFSQLLESSGALQDGCSGGVDESGGGSAPALCLTQEESDEQVSSSMAFIYTAASSAFIFASFPGGLLLDHMGPGITASLAGLLLSAGFVLVACGADGFLTPAFVLVGMGCSLSYSTAIKTQFLFRQERGNLVNSAVNALFDASALVPLVLQLAFREAPEAHPSHRRQAAFYGLAAFGALLFALWAAAWGSMHSSRLRIASSKHVAAQAQTREGRQSDAQANEATLEDAQIKGVGTQMRCEGCLEAEAPPIRPLAASPLATQVRAPQLWLLCIWAAILYLRQSYYLAAARGTLQERGGVDGEGERYVTILVAMAPMSIVIGPMWALAINRVGHVRVMRWLAIASSLGYAGALIPSLPFQVVTFAMLYGVRAGMYPVACSYLAKTFGERSTGATLGIMLFVCGLFNLTVYPLSLVTSEVFSGDPGPVFLALSVIPTIPHLLVVNQLSMHKAGFLPFRAPWKGLMKQLRTEVRRRAKPNCAKDHISSCPVCLVSPMEQSLELACGHILCSPCATKMSGQGFRNCPVCRHRHLLDPKLLRERSLDWRRAYGGWRQGRGRGAAGEVGSITKQPRHRQSGKQGGMTANGAISGIGPGSLLIRALDLANAQGRTKSHCQGSARPQDAAYEKTQAQLEEAERGARAGTAATETIRMSRTESGALAVESMPSHQGAGREYYKDLDA